MQGFALAYYFNCIFKYTQTAVWVLKFIKTFFNQIWDGSTIAPTASLIVWHWHETFMGSENFVL